MLSIWSMNFNMTLIALMTTPGLAWLNLGKTPSITSSAWEAFLGLYKMSASNIDTCPHSLALASESKMCFKFFDFNLS